MRTVLLLLFAVSLCSCEQKPVDKKVSYPTVFEESKGTETATYQETIDFYTNLAKDFPAINIQTVGQTDSGYPLHMVTFNPDGDFNFQKIRLEKTIILINNGIHPGESDGIDATMLLFRDMALNIIEKPENVVLVTIPIYNVGGALNRNSTTRTNQNGPKSYGFRGNAKNYDLNRDFIKSDTKNAQAFAQIFHLVKPDVFIDNHVSNGADYQYTLTHLFTQHNKLGGELGEYLYDKIRPGLESALTEAGWPITPYVNVFNRPPETGFSQFMDHPRYSTGYTTLWDTMGMMVETHMLKPYDQRVEGTYKLMEQMLFLLEAEHDKIKEVRANTLKNSRAAEDYYLNWIIDSTRVSTLQFLGFEADTLMSNVTGFERLKYDRTKPFSKKVSYFNHFIASDTVKIPAAYLVKKEWQAVMQRLKQNQIAFFEMEKDSTLEVESYKIASYQTRNNAYEGHYPHYNTSIDKENKKVAFRAGDFVIPSDQPGIRYLLETLEPIAPDSFFNWNFFDAILQQKEGFSPYVFEEIAHELLLKDETLRNSFLAKKQSDTLFAQNWYAQLDWVHKNSPYYEEAHLQYPVYRILKNSEASTILERD